MSTIMKQFFSMSKILGYFGLTGQKVWNHFQSNIIFLKCERAFTLYEMREREEVGLSVPGHMLDNPLVTKTLKFFS